MPSSPGSLAEPAFRERLSRGIESPADGVTTRAAAFVARAFGPAALALIHYGSHAQGSGAAPESAHDFFVILDEYPSGYRSLATTRPSRRSPGMAARLNRVLPPNVISVHVPLESGDLTAKCAVLNRADLQRACTGRYRDLWVAARLFQQVQIAWARDATARSLVIDCIIAARQRTFEWGRPILPDTFDETDYFRALLLAGYRAEIRPEREERIDTLVASQRDAMLPIYADLLDHLADAGELARVDGRFRDARPPGSLARLSSRWFFACSKLRATLRWGKYMALYDDWLDYVIHKVERRGGVSVELTPRERRWPLLFLWPKAIRALGRPARRR